MFTQTTPLPPLQPQNTTSQDVFTASNIRTEMTKMQQSLQRCNQIYNDYFSNIPPNIPGSIKSIQDSLNNISKETQKNFYQNFQKSLSKYNSLYDTLSASLKHHIETTQNMGQADSFSDKIPAFEKSLEFQNKKLLENLERQLNEKVNNSEMKTKEKIEEPKFKLVSPFSESQKIDAQKIVSKEKTFSTLDTVLNLEKHNERLQSLENKIDIALNRQKEIQSASENETHQKISDIIFENHVKVRNLAIKANVIAQKFYHPPPVLNEEKPYIQMKKKSNVKLIEFNAFTNNVNALNEKLLGQIDFFETTAHNKISDFNKRVDQVESTVIDFEKSINQMNEMITEMNERIDNVEVKQDEMISSKGNTIIGKSALTNLIDSFRAQLAVIQKEAKNEIAQLKKQLDTIENSFS
ncbi:hypothetical protein TRFO_09571 [Tritrichomonas foetus]|uniref:Uncharacterized protein n=1 Tax=Tritrichomonas foetus TaxID=1144522 RepID=A0A1J4JG52_9EUKA|nr:hypothetical protein TRFO_09571 [Tritrichomonas foetus]|eukprot:OHS97287.1 hypothetical protein TRFO_09571 [Tritrichomonas foetus]